MRRIINIPRRSKTTGRPSGCFLHCAQTRQQKHSRRGYRSTANCFIDELANIKHTDAAVASSEETHKRLLAHGISVLDLNAAPRLDVYVDGADEIDQACNMIKGGGAALTREKIVAAAADEFVCIADNSKLVSCLGTFPLPIEVIPMARGLVARAL